jgi:hypothetical protein
MVRMANRLIAVCLTCSTWLLAGLEGRGQEPAPTVPKAAATLGVPEAVFTTRRIKTTVEPGTGEVALTYDFTNRADLPLVVEGFVHSCGCMLGDWDGKPVEIGATGRIKATFLTKGLRGTVTKSLLVKFVGFGTVELSAEVTIPETLTYSAQTLRWPVGGKPESRVIDIAVSSARPVRVLSVKGDAAFNAALETVREGRRYRITITPLSLNAERVGVFQVRTDATDPRDALQGLFALVERSAAAPPAVGKGGPP